MVRSMLGQRARMYDRPLDSFSYHRRARMTRSTDQWEAVSPFALCATAASIIRRKLKSKTDRDVEGLSRWPSQQIITDKIAFRTGL